MFDRREVVIGSLNLDPRSITENTEIGVVVASPEIAQDMSSWFDETDATRAFRLELLKGETGAEKIRWHGQLDGKPQVFDVDPYTGFWQRFGIGFMSLLPIESQL